MLGSRSSQALSALVLVLVLALVATACGGNSNDNSQGSNSSTTVDPTGNETTSPGTESGDETEASYGGAISVGLRAETANWIPGEAVGTGALMVALSIYDPLVSLTADGDFEPFLAESIDHNDDASEWTVTLRDGVLFADGSPLDAETLKWNFDTIHHREGSRTLSTLTNAGVLDMEVVDPLTVRYLLDGPNAGFPDVLRGAVGWPISRLAYEADPKGYGQNPVGTGPFVMTEWIRDDRIVVKRNENYWFKAANGDQLPYLDQITFRPIPDENSRTQSLASNDLQMIHSSRGSFIKQIIDLVEAGPYEYSLHTGNTAAATYLNVLVPPFDDTRVRQALAYASNMDAIAQILGDDGLTEPTFQLFSTDSPWYSPAADAAYPEADGRNLDAAIELLDAYRNDPNRSDGKAVGAALDPIKYMCPTDPVQVQMAALYQGLWDDLGVEVKVDTVDEPTLVSRFVGSADTSPPFVGDYDTSCTYISGGEGDPFTAIAGAFGPVATTPGNITNFTDPRIDDLLEDLKSTVDLATRKEIVEKISIIVAEEAPIIWASKTPTIVAYSNKLHGVKDWRLPSGELGNGTPVGDARFHQVFIAK